jgi:hypothetical protein
MAAPVLNEKCQIKKGLFGQEVKKKENNNNNNNNNNIMIIMTMR